MRHTRNAPTGVRQIIAVVLPARLPTDPAWPQGPLPFTHGARTTTTHTRRTYFTPAVASVLYGTPDHPTRWHRHFHHTHGPLTVDGVELLRTPTDDNPDRAVAILHLTIAGPELLDTLRALARRPGTTPLPLAAESALNALLEDNTHTGSEPLLGGRATIESDALPYTVTLLTPSRVSLPRLHRGRDHRRWPPTQQWLWALASRTNADDYPPDPATVPQLTGAALRLSADWSALVLRQGAAFIGHRRDHGPSDPFYGYAELHARSIYLDALLLGMIQRTHIDHLTEDLAQVFTGPGEANRLSKLERRIAHFRSTYWRQHLTTHGIANDLLIAYQQQYRLSDRFTEILAEAADHNRLIQTQENQQISGALGVLTILGLPLGTALGVLQVLGDDDPWHLVTATSGALAATAVLLTTRYGRLVLAALRGRSPGDRDQ
ncbi:hypothetical protein [Streptomyces reniochalinae]|uniref:CorA-like Mg2+ transporter protein n=1 Tax=Streptomyces reniochalinae TaxID=2250578 RepID=A0A367E8B8_9ACTN|nr:hypothetical protein [Streptomyces reniochalinae]RCG13480.1 hypothetical protein DQ392_32545 [Streptomyces reniochalinae]